MQGRAQECVFLMSFQVRWGPDVRPTLRVADICALPSKGQFRDIIDPGIPGSIEEA